MFRQEITNQLDHDPHFKWRGETVTRLENLSDIVFALALGFLISSSTPPTTFDELLPHLGGIIPISAGFAVMLMIWRTHFTFFRRYGFADGRIVFLNATLLLLILFIAHPLAFSFESFFAFVIGIVIQDWTMMDAMGIETYRQAGVIISCFHIGYAFVFFLIERMYHHALKISDVLNLSSAEQIITTRTIWICRIQVFLALIIAPFAWLHFLGPVWGFVGILNWPAAIFINHIFKLTKEETTQVPKRDLSN